MDVDEFLQYFGLSLKYIKRGKAYYLYDEKLEGYNDVVASGVFLGSMKKHFVPSFPLLEMIQTDKEAIVDKKAAWLFLCGRDMFKEGIKRLNGKGLVLVKNELNEILGLGKVVNKGNVVIKHVLDRGDFLRRER